MVAPELDLYSSVCIYVPALLDLYSANCFNSQSGGTDVQYTAIQVLHAKTHEYVTGPTVGSLTLGLLIMSQWQAIQASSIFFFERWQEAPTG